MSLLFNKTFLLDIETNGLNAQHHAIISIGLLYEANAHPQVKFLFNHTLSEERALLEVFLNWCQSYECVVTFRGKVFDYPFLLERLKYYKLDPSPFLKLKCVDTETALKLFSTKRMILEELFNFTRHSTTTGEEILRLYNVYLTSQDSRYKKLILMHQQDELLSLFRFWECYYTFYHLKSAKLYSESWNDHHFKVIFHFPYAFMHSFSGTVDTLNFYYEKETSLFYLTGSLLTTTLKRPLLPIKDYFYIEEQKQLVHKSLAIFIPSHQKRKATKKDCFIEETHTFFKVYTTYRLKNLIWYDLQNTPYIIWEEPMGTILAHQIFSLFFQKVHKRS